MAFGTRVLRWAVYGPFGIGTRSHSQSRTSGPGRSLGRRQRSKLCLQPGSAQRSSPCSRHVCGLRSPQTTSTPQLPFQTPQIPFHVGHLCPLGTSGGAGLLLSPAVSYDSVWPWTSGLLRSTFGVFEFVVQLVPSFLSQAGQACGP